MTGDKAMKTSTKLFLKSMFDGKVDDGSADRHRGLLAHDAMAAMSISMLDRAGTADPRHISTA